MSKKGGWANDSKNKNKFEIPISVIKEDDHWVAAFNEDTYKIFPNLPGAAMPGQTKEEAINKLVSIINLWMDHLERTNKKYRPWVPFKKGDWSQIGGTWFEVFGFYFYLRYGEGMKGGAYIPFTKLNLIFENHWKRYD